MNITHYYLHFSHGSNAKNKLQEAAKKMLLKLNETLIVKEDLKEVQNSIIDSIDKINKENSRCKALKIHFSKSMTAGEPCTEILWGFEAVCFYFRPATLTHAYSVTYKSLSNN
jgi:hypothetical protein